MSRPKGSKNKSKYTAILVTDIPKKRGRKPKLKPHLELALTQSENKPESIPEEDRLVKGGQKTACKKCGIEINLFVQPKLADEKLKNVVCSRCQ